VPSVIEAQPSRWPAARLSSTRGATYQTESQHGWSTRER
jgi:hypothetical protein